MVLVYTLREKKTKKKGCGGQEGKKWMKYETSTKKILFFRLNVNRKIEIPKLGVDYFSPIESKSIEFGKSKLNSFYLAILILFQMLIISFFPN